MNAHSSASRAPRVAIFVDGENLPADHAAAIQALAAEAGRADWHRVYGDVTQMPRSGRPCRAFASCTAARARMPPTC